MTSHELARKLLEGPNVTVAATVVCDNEYLSGLLEPSVKLGSYTEDRIYISSDGVWRDEYNQLPTHVFLSVKTESEFVVVNDEDEAG